MSDLLTIKGARVIITGSGVTPVKGDRDAVHAAVLANRSNRFRGTADQQAIAMYVIALFRVLAGATADSLAARRDWIAAGRPHIVVDVADLLPENRGMPPREWNDGAYLAAQLRWIAGVAGVTVPEIGRVRVTKDGWKAGDHRFYLIPSAPE